jgi:uncharacterized SAM-binding protein YcdF (DUF218 family)
MARRGLALLPLLALPALGLLDPPHSPAPGTVRADAALVLSGDVDFLRLRRAAALYAAGEVGALLVTGSGIGGDDAAVLRREAERLGVPPGAIRSEPASRTTRENLAFAAQLVRREGWRRVALVTSASHMGRAERVARRALPEVTWIAVTAADAGPWTRVYRQRLSEWLKLALYRARGWA